MTENIGGEVFVRIIPLPVRVGAVVLPNDDGTYDVYLSSHLTQKQREQKLAHELGHVKGQHFYRELDVTLAEEEACAAKTEREHEGRGQNKKRRRAER